jgi:hypothetical protein
VVERVDACAVVKVRKVRRGEKVVRRPRDEGQNDKIKIN